MHEVSFLFIKPESHVQYNMPVVVCTVFEKHTLISKAGF